MPTAAKLFGAFAFLLVGFFTAEMIKDAYPADLSSSYFSLICAGLGLLAGWTVMGPAAGGTRFQAMGTGLKTSVVLAIWGLFTFSINEMVVRSTARRYDGVMDAIEGLAGILLDFLTILVRSGPSMLVLIVGGLLGGLFASWAALRWR